MLLHDSVFEATTQDTLIAIAVRTFDSPTSPNPVLKYGVLRLRNTPKSHEVGTIAFQLLGSLGQLSRPSFLYPSFNGTGRVFFMQQSGARGTISMFEYNLRMGGDDGVQDAKVVEYPSILQFPTSPRFLDYDPYSCRICVQPAMLCDTVEIYELAA